VGIFKILTIAVLINIISGITNTGHAQVTALAEYYGFKEIEIVKLNRGIQNLKIADLNSDGRNDIAVVNNIKARIELMIQKEVLEPGEPEIAVDLSDIDINTIIPPTRFEKQSITISQKVYSLVCGDLNSDGTTDLAFYGEPKGLYVILQKDYKVETGPPESPTNKLSWQTRNKIKIDDGLLTSNMLTCADLNNDGADDLALAGRDGVYIVVQKEDGTLAEPVKYPTSAQTLGVEVGDLNGDNVNDLILITNDMEKPVHVRFGFKTGQLGPQVRYFIERPSVFKITDIDDEDSYEILTVNGRSGRLICYKFAAENRKDIDWPSLFYPLTSGQEDTKRDLEIGDFDGDGLIDVLISEPGAAELIFYKQIPGLGLAEPVRFPAFADMTNLSAVDINRDGKVEIGVLSVKEKVIGISKFENDRISFPQPIDLQGQPLAMELCDVDNDGNVDCLYISTDDNNVRTLRTIYNLMIPEKNQTNPANSNKFERIAENAGPNKPDLELEKLTSNPDGLEVLDVDQDGLQDVLIFVSYEPPILIRQTEKRNFEVIDSPKAQSSLIKDATLRSIALADMDGKPGKELLVAQKNFARSLVFSEGLNWSIIDQYNAKSTENQISAVAAFNIYDEVIEKRPAILLLDGRKGQLQILKTGNDKTYRFVKELDIGQWNPAMHFKMMFAPLTGDKTKSLLLFDSEKFAIITPPSSGNFAQHLEQQFSYETKIKDGKYGNLTAGDINSDNRTDLIMVEYKAIEPKHNHIEILTFDSSLNPVPAMRFKIFEQKSYRSSRAGPNPNIEPRELMLADVTNDGKEDLVTIIHDRIIIYPQD
jgi:hypothetical protein